MNSFIHDRTSGHMTDTTSAAPRERDYLFDNLKAFMLFLVVIGHILDPYIERQDSLYRYLMQYIYLFHMPMFAFITGYFTKNTDKARNMAVRNVLIPYTFWQLLYIAVALLFIRLGLASYNTDVFKPSLLLPSSPLYYLLCVFVWKVFAKDLLKLRCPVLFAFVSGLLVSTIFDEAFHIGWGACFSLLIFFVLGLKCTEDHVRKIRNLPHLPALAILAAAVIPSVVLPYSFRNVRFTYESVGLSPALGIGYRALFYLIAVLMIGALINLFPERKNCFSRVGTNAILVYAGSSFAAPALYLLIARFIPLAGSVYGNLAGMTVFAAALVMFCQMEWIRNIYDWVIEGICKVIFK